MRVLTAIMALVASSASAQTFTAPATVPNLSGYATTGALQAVQQQIPSPLTGIPPAPTPGGQAGVSATYIPGDAAVKTLCRRTSTTTASDGTFSVTWAVALTSVTPWAGVDPIWTSSSMPPICWMTSATATGVTGKCVNTQTTSVTTALVTTGLTVNPFGSGAASLPVKVHACEPTQ